MKSTYHDISGNAVDASVALDGRGVIKHGYFVKVPRNAFDGSMMTDGRRLSLVDGVPAIVTDADLQARSDAIDARNARLSDAWRNPPPELPVKQEQERTVAADSAAIHQAYDERISNAWRS